jgi:tight adherence protein C
MEIPYVVWIVLAPGGFALAVFGARGLVDLRASLQEGRLAALANPPRWPLTRAFIGMIAALPVVTLTASLGAGRWLAAICVAGLAYAATPRFLASARDRAQRETLDHLPLHLDLVALALEGGSSLPGAFALCAEHAPEGVLKRAWSRVLIDVHAGAEPADALRELEDRLGVRLFGHLLSALRSAEKFALPIAPLIRDKARQAAANRFARAEQSARAAPLKLWAALVLCLAPCSLVVLAFPVAKLLAWLAGN